MAQVASPSRAQELKLFAGLAVQPFVAAVVGFLMFPLIERLAWCSVWPAPRSTDYVCREESSYEESSRADAGDLRRPSRDDNQSGRSVGGIGLRQREPVLDLGNGLPLRFTDERMPRRYRDVERMFRRRGAYARFKDLLDREGLLDQWYAYEAAVTERALRAWCERVGLQVGTSEGFARGRHGP